MGLNRHVAAGALAVLTCIWPTWTRAQTGGCAVAAHTDPPRQVLVCADGLTMTAERGADYRMLDRNRDGRPDAVEVRSRALLLELSAGNRRGSFQVLTPHAIASVRGTVWAVDVGPERTSVLVREGRVTVAPPRATEQVQLGPGQGVDVEPGRPLEVKQWSAERVARLLARFGR
jgi:ferric-dicitrate binding protein FerR (iron transport regulator)